jgi:mycothiol synthase
MLAPSLTLLEAPALPGLTFRHFQGPADYPRMLVALNGSKDADRLDDVDTLETLINTYTHAVNCDLYQDVLLAEVDGQVAGYARVYWVDALDGNRLYLPIGFVLPQWRGRGIGRALLAFCERRAEAMAAGHAPGQRRFLQVFAFENETAKRRLLERAGYMPARYSYSMVRPDLENIPEAPLPAGLEVRPARPEHYRAIWEANDEAFRDHWSYVPRAEEDYQTWLGEDTFQPEVWKVAWDAATGQVAGMVLGFILAEQNAKFQRRRGWTEDICVRRPYRRRGLAHALIAASLRELKARGMTEAALGVDAENLSGALGLYESLGYRTVQRHTLYRKSLL